MNKLCVAVAVLLAAMSTFSQALVFPGGNNPGSSILVAWTGAPPVMAYFGLLEPYNYGLLIFDTNAPAYLTEWDTGTNLTVTAAGLQPYTTYGAYVQTIDYMGNRWSGPTVYITTGALGTTATLKPKILPPTNLQIL